MEQKQTLSGLFVRTQKMAAQYKRIGTILGDNQLSNWFIIYSEQKEIFTKQLASEITKFAELEADYSSPNLVDDTDETELIITSPNQYKLVTKKQEQEVMVLYHDVIEQNNLPDSITLTLLRQRDQIGLALRHLEKIRA